MTSTSQTNDSNPRRPAHLPQISLRPVAMKSGATKLQLRSPFHPDLSDRARSAAGTWNGTDRAWYFDTRDVEVARQICRDLWGIDPADPEPPEVVDIRVTITSRWGGADLWLAGRVVVERRFRDRPVGLGDGVSIAEGSFPPAGGSAKYPALSNREDVTVLMRDVPRAIAERIAAREWPNNALAIALVEESAETADDASATLARLAHIDADRRAAQAAAQPGAVSPLEAAWAAVQALPEVDQLEIRNRLLASL